MRKIIFMLYVAGAFSLLGFYYWLHGTGVLNIHLNG